MRALVTGGVGFIGRHLCHRMEPEWDLTALDILSPQVHADPEAARRSFPARSSWAMWRTSRCGDRSRRRTS